MKITVGTNQPFTTVHAALEAAKSYAAQEVTIHILPGRYYEKLEITQPNVTLEGESADSVIIVYDDYANEIMPDGRKRGTFWTYTLLVDAHHVTLRHLTVENAAGSGQTVGQAIALYAEGDGIIVDNCRLIGSQDTLFTGPLPLKEAIPGGFRGPKQFAPRINGRQYYKDTYICGGIDFIFGSATAYFENCTIESLDEPEGYVTAASTPEGQAYGYVFDRCRFTGRGKPQSKYLGRPWRDHARVVILRCELGAHIHPDGWHDWNKPLSHQTVYYAEYENYGPGAAADRPDWIHRLSSEEAALYTKERVLG